MKNYPKVLSALKVIGAIYGIALLIVSMVYLVNSLFPNDGPYPEMNDRLESIVQYMWGLPFMIALFALLGCAIIFPIFLREMKRLNTKENTWTAPVWFANMIISIWVLVPGAFIIIGFSNFVMEIPRSPWNLISSIVIGYLFLFTFHNLARRFMPNDLERITKKLLG